MKHELQVDLTRQVLEHVDAGTTCMAPDVSRQPVSAYTCEQRFAREQKTLFSETPLVMALSCQIPNPGDYITNDYTGAPVVMVRGRDGQARAFLNVCRHRGARVVDGQGTARKVLSCPYHGWSYDLDGTLAHIPDASAFDGVDPACHGLAALPLAERHGMIWVRPSAGDEIDVSLLLGELEEDIASFAVGEQMLYTTLSLIHI